MAQVSESLIPRVQEFVAVLFCDVKNIVGFLAAKPFGESKFERIEPEFGGAIFALNVDVRWLEPVGHVKEETEPPLA